jgi:glucokinase
VGHPVVLAFDFGGSQTRVAVADPDGERLAQAAVATQPAKGANWNFAQAVTLAWEVMGGTDPLGDLVAVGAATFGIPTEGGVLLAPAIPGWGALALRRELVKAFDCPAVRVGTDVKAAAGAEAQSGALAGCDPAIYLNLGTGLAVGVICGGQVVHGANRAAGEIGYNLRRVADLEAAAGDSVRLEDIVSGAALAAVGSRVTRTGLSAADVFAGEPDHHGLAEVLDDFVRHLSFHLVNLCVALNPARVAVGGGIVRSWSRIEPQLSQALTTFVPFPPELVPGAYPFDAALVGAVALAVDEANQGRDITSITKPVPYGH